MYVTPARIEILWEKYTSNVLTLDLVAYDPDFSEIKLLPRYKRMVTWKLVEPLLTPHRRYPDKMTSPFVWKSIASTFSLPLGLLEQFQPLLFGPLDRLRQQSQFWARGKNNYLIACPTIPNVCLFVCWCWCYCFFDSWTKERVERLGFFSFCTLSKLLCQGLVNLLTGSEGLRYPCFKNQIVLSRTNPLQPLLE